MVLDNTSSNQNKLEIRKSIKSIFQVRECTTLIRPVTDEEKLQNLFSLDDSELRPDFIRQIINLRKRIFENLNEKNFKNLDGNMLIDMITSYISNINKGSIPNISNTFEIISLAQSRKSIESSEKIYDSLINYFLSLCNELREKSISSYCRFKINSNLSESDIRANKKAILSKIFSINSFMIDNAVVSEHFSDFLSKYNNTNVSISSLVIKENFDFIKEICIENYLLNMKFCLESINNHNSLRKMSIQNKLKISFPSSELNNEYSILIDNINKKKNYYLEIYEEDTKNSLNKLLHFEYSKFEQILNQENIPSLDGLIALINDVGPVIENFFPDYSFIKEFYNEFRGNILILILKYFKIKNDNEENFQKNESKIVIDNLKNDIYELKNKLSRLNSSNDEKIESYKVSVNELKSEILSKNEKLSHLEQELFNKNKDFSDQIIKLKDEMNKKQQDFNNKSKTLEEKLLDSERIRIQHSAEFEKEKALLLQQLEFVNKQNEESKKNDSITNLDLISNYKEQHKSLKETILKLEKTIVELNGKINNLNDKLYDTENNYNEVNLKLNEEVINTERLKKEIRTANEEKLKIIKDYELKIDSEKSKFSSKIDGLNKEIEEIKNLNSVQIEELRKNYNKTIELQKEENNKLNFENNQLKLTIQNLKIENEDILNKNNTLKMNYDSVLNKILKQTDIDKDSKQNFELLKETLLNEKAKIVSEYEDKIHQLNNKNESVEQIFNEKVKRLEIEKDDLEKSIMEFKIKNEKLNSDLLLTKKTLLENQKSSQIILEESEIEASSKIKELEKEIERSKKQSIEEIGNINSNFEEQIKRLRSLFEVDKERLEEKLRNEKLNADKKLKRTIADYESKINELESELKQEIEILNNEIETIKYEYNSYVIKAEKEIDLLKQSKDTLEGLWEASKLALIKNQQQYKESYDLLSETSSLERNDMIKKNENLHNEYLIKERELTTANYNIIQLETQLNEIREQLIISRSDLERERNNYNSLKEDMNEK